MLLALAAATRAHAADPFEIPRLNAIRVHLQIDLPTFLSSLHAGFGLGDAGALVESRAIEVNIAAQSTADPNPLDQLAHLLQQSPFDVGDSGQPKPGFRLDLFSPGDIGVGVKYRW